MKYCYLTLFIALAIIACKDEEKKSCVYVFCQNGGICYDGECLCPGGYTGSLCEIPPGPCYPCLSPKVCMNNVCGCPAGREGVECNIETWKKMVGTYTINNARCSDIGGTPLIFNYSATITKGATDSTLVIDNLLGFGELVNAVIVDSNIISLYHRFANGNDVNGNARFNAADSSLAFQLMYANVDSGITYLCTHAFVK